MKKIFLFILFAASVPLTRAQSLAQDPFVYQFLAGRANDHTWQLNGILFRDDPAVPMLTRSFANRLLYNYTISNSMPELEYGNGKALINSNPAVLYAGKNCYSIAGTDLSLMNGMSINSRLSKDHSQQLLKVTINHQYFQNRLDANNDKLLDKPLKNDINSSFAYSFNVNERTSLTTTATALSERWTSGRTDIGSAIMPVSSMNTIHNSNHYAVRSILENKRHEKKELTSLDIQASAFDQNSNTGSYRYSISNNKITALGGWHSKERWEFISAGTKAIISAESLEEKHHTITYDRSSITAGAYAELNLRPRSWFGIELRHRSTFSTLYRWNHAPLARISIYKFKKLRMFAYGMLDQQVVHPLASGMQYITGTRKIAWHGHTLDRYARTGVHTNDTYWNRWVRHKLSYNYTHYFARNITDVYSDPNTLYLYEVNNASRDHTIEAALHLLPLMNALSASLLYRFDDVKARIAGSMKQLPFYPRHSLMLDLTFAHKWYSYSNYRDYHYPYVNASVLFSSGIYEPARNDGSISKAPALLTLHAKAFVPFSLIYHWKDHNEKNKWLERFQLTLGSDNITNVKRQDVILRPPGDQSAYEGPASRGPLSGRRFYFGLIFNPGARSRY